ncbi:MAG TPA: HlyD family secretion protein [Terriglobia bacterium]|nr:HlyD family secretion protein [Terriglobia bacterium]
MTRGRILVAVVLLLAIGAGLVAWRMLSGRESTDDARIDGHVHPVSSRVGGTVVAIEVMENQPVEAGAALVRLDDSSYRIALARAEADLAVATARHRETQTQLPASSVEASARTSSSDALLMRAQTTVHAAERDLDVARAKLETARVRANETTVRVATAKRDLDRLKPLLDKDEISRQQYDSYVSALDAARASENSARAAIMEAETGVGLAEARVNEAKSAIPVAESGVQAATAGKQDVAASQARIALAAADIERARAAVDQAKLDLDRTVIHAPVAGIVSKRGVELGSVVQPGQPLMAIVPLEDVWVTANFKETQLDNIHPGQTAEIKVDAYGAETFHARVDSIASATGATFSLLPPENASGNFVKVVQRVPVKLVITDKPAGQFTLRPGMSVEVTVITGPARN